MRLHGGSLSVSSEGLNRGTTFTVELPLFTKIDKKPEYHPVNHEEGISKIFKSSRKLKFLIVDDSKLNRSMMQKLIFSNINSILNKDRNSLYDFEVEQAGDGGDAVLYVKENPSVQAIFIDSLMINMNGPEAITKIRNELNYKGLIVSVTGNTLQKDIDICIEAGADFVIHKPVKNEELCKVLLGFFGSSEIRPTELEEGYSLV